MSGEDRIFMQWADGSFITLTDPDLTLLVRKLGAPETVEFRAHDEGYVTVTAAEYCDDDDDDDDDGPLPRIPGLHEVEFTSSFGVRRGKSVMNDEELEDTISSLEKNLEELQKLIKPV